MMRFKFLATAAATAIVMAASAADAAVTFQFSGVTFRPGTTGNDDLGTLTGTFTTDDALAVITDFNITASAAGANPGLTNFPFRGYNFTTANSRVVAATLPSLYFVIMANVTNDPSLTIFFNTPLTTSGTTINNTSSSESEGLSASRVPTGSIIPVATAVPEPATWSMMMVGAALIAGSIRYRRRKSVVTFA